MTYSGTYIPSLWNRDLRRRERDATKTPNRFLHGQSSPIKSPSFSLRFIPKNGVCNVLCEPRTVTHSYTAVGGPLVQIRPLNNSTLDGGEKYSPKKGPFSKTQSVNRQALLI